MRIFNKKLNISNPIFVPQKRITANPKVAPDMSIKLDQKPNDYLRRLFVQDTDTIEQTWGSNAFSTLKDIAPGQEFIFLVHAVLPQSIREFRASQLRTEGYSVDQIHLPTYPYKISEKDLICCSVISNSHSETFTDYGFILDAPVSCYRGASPEDANSKPPKEGKSWSWQNRSPFVGKYIESGPQGLIRDSLGWNEVNLTGTSQSNNDKVKPIGIFIKSKNDKLQIDQEDLEKMKLTCIGLPVVIIERSNGQISKVFRDLNELSPGDASTKPRFST